MNVEFSALDRQPDLPALKARVLERWRERDVFRRTLEAREGADLFVAHCDRVTVLRRPLLVGVVAVIFLVVTATGYAIPAVT